MTGHIYHPERKHPDPYQKDLGPDASKGINYGTIAEPAKRSAYDVKDLHERLQDFSADELKQMTVLCEGTRLETGAKYIDLRQNKPQEYEAQGDEEVEEGGVFLAKKDIPFELWNRLIGIDDPNRTKLDADEE